jgi:hypothetical protein
MLKKNNKREAPHPGTKAAGRNPTPDPSRGAARGHYENRESWTPGAGTPPDPTETPREAAHAAATDQATHHEQPKRPQSQEANRGHAAATREERGTPATTGTRETASANQPKTRDHPKARTTDTAEGNGAPAEEDQPTTKQRNKKKRHARHRPTPKKATPTHKKAAPSTKKKHPNPGKSHPKRSPRPTDGGTRNNPPIFEIPCAPQLTLNGDA